MAQTAQLTKVDSKVASDTGVAQKNDLGGDDALPSNLRGDLRALQSEGIGRPVSSLFNDANANLDSKTVLLRSNVGAAELILPSGLKIMVAPELNTETGKITGCSINAPRTNSNTYFSVVANNGGSDYNGKLYTTVNGDTHQCSWEENKNAASTRLTVNCTGLDGYSTDGKTAPFTRSVTFVTASDAQLWNGLSDDLAKMGFNYVKVLPEGGLDINPGQVFFAQGKAQLSKEATDALTALAQFAKNNGLTVKCEGYANQVGAAEVNMNLSYDRAEAVAAVFRTQGVPLENILVQGFGKEVSPTGSYAGDRQVNIKFF